VSTEITEIRQQVFEALGEVSMCWSERPAGVFDDVKARQIGERLIRDIKRLQIFLPAITLDSTLPSDTIRIGVSTLTNCKAVEDA
jgi:hypothetical protein